MKTRSVVEVARWLRAKIRMALRVARMRDSELMRAARTQPLLVALTFTSGLLLAYQVAAMTASLLVHEGRVIEVAMQAIADTTQAPIALNGAPGTGLRVVAPELVVLMNRMMDLSPSFRDEAKDAARNGVPIWVARYDQIPTDRKEDQLGHAIPVVAWTGRVRSVVIWVDLDHFYTAYAGPDLQGLGDDPDAVRDSEAMAALAHEFAHAYELSRHGKGWIHRYCFDPLPWQKPLESCVMKAENRFRREAGLPEADSYGVVSAHEALIRNRLHGNTGIGWYGEQSGLCLFEA